MSYLNYSSGWIRQDNGSSLNLNLAGRYVQSARIEFRGVTHNWTTTDEDYNAVTISGNRSSGAYQGYTQTTPVPAGWDFWRIEAGSRLIPAGQQDQSVKVTIGNRPEQTNSRTNSVFTTEVTDISTTYTSLSTLHQFSSNGPYEYQAFTVTRWRRTNYHTAHTENPAVTLNGQTAQYNGTLTNGQSSGLIVMPGLIDNQTNTLHFSSGGSNRCEVRITYQYVSLPGVHTDNAKDVKAYTAKISGQLTTTGGDPETYCYLEYGESPGNYNLGTIEFGPFSTMDVFEVTLSGLEVQETYYFRAYAVNVGGTAYGPERSFTTIAYAPSVQTEPATGIDYLETVINATLLGTGGAITSCYFEYGETNNLELGELWVEDRTTAGTYSLLLSGLDYDKTYHFRAKAVNEIGQDVGIVRTFTTPYPFITAPTEGDPGSGEKTDNLFPAFEFTLGGHAVNPAGLLHARIRFSEYVAMSPIVQAPESRINQNGWAAFLNDTWEPFPEEGVPTYTRVRYTVQNALPYGSVYWDGAAWDGDRYGTNSQSRLIRVSITPEGPYSLYVGGQQWDFLEMLTVTEASNGELGSVEFMIDNQDGQASYIEHGDQVVLSISDAQGELEDFVGRVRRTIPEGNDLRVFAILGDGFLAERIIREDYPAADVGQIVADIVTGYLTPLTTEYVDINTGFTAPVTAKDRKAVRVLEEIRRNYGLYYYVDKEDRFHLYRPEDIVEPVEPLTIRRGD